LTSKKNTILELNNKNKTTTLTVHILYIIIYVIYTDEFLKYCYSFLCIRKQFARETYNLTTKSLCAFSFSTFLSLPKDINIYSHVFGTGPDDINPIHSSNEGVDNGSIVARRTCTFSRWENTAKSQFI